MNIEYVQDFVKIKLESEPTGHDYLHALRVLENAKQLLIDDVDEDVIYACCLVHDLIDYKLDQEYKLSDQKLHNLLLQSGLSTTQTDHVFHIIQTMSFHQGTIPNSVEGQIVQDADRLDALGAIGIARAFSFGGKHNRLIYHPDTIDGDDSVSHFYQKLLLLADKMNTKKAQQEAHKRTQFMKDYLLQLDQEIQRGGNR